MNRIVMPILLIFCGIIFSSCSNIFLNYGYNVSGNKVLYKNAFPGNTIEIKEADAKTFKVIFQPSDGNYNSNTDFAVDKDHVFYGGGMIDGSDGKSFVAINLFFSKDKNQCYYKGKVIPGADPASFKIKDETYSMDKSNVYKGTQLMDNDASIFEGFDSSTVVHTAHAVSVFENIIPMPTNATFQYLKFNYYAINNQVYFQDIPLEGVTADGFKGLDNFFSKTPHHVYYGEKLIADADPATFIILQSPYGKDAHHIFFFERTIAGADPKTFEILNIKFQCARDKHGAYSEDVKIKNVTAEDMASKKECISCNAQQLYFADK